MSSPLRLRRRADFAIRRRCALIGDALEGAGIAQDLDTGLSLIALGLELLLRRHKTREPILRFCELVLDTPEVDDPKAHTGGT